MKTARKHIYYFSVIALIFVLSSHAMAVVNQSLTINGYASIAGESKIPALLHITRSEDKADRVKQPGYRCCALGVLAMEFEFPVASESSDDIVSGGFHFSDFEGPRPLTGSRKLLTISHEGGTVKKIMKVRTHSWMASGETFGYLSQRYAAWHFALLQQQDALMFLHSFVQHQSKNIAITITDSQRPAIQLQANFVPGAAEAGQIRKIVRSGLPKN